MLYDNIQSHIFAVNIFRENTMSASPFVKIEREESLSYKVERQIREAIRQKIFLAGDKLPGEFELAERFGVSRTAIREALRMLSGRGLVHIRKGSGVYVAEMDAATVVDPFYHLLEMKCGETSLLHLIRVRSFMEPEIARLAAIHRSGEDVEYLAKQYQNMVSFADQPYRMIESDIKFHRRIASATNNPIVPIIMEPIFLLLHKFISETYKQSHAPDLALKNHENLLAAIRAHDAENAYQTMKKHMSEAEQHVINYYQSINVQVTA